MNRVNVGNQITNGMQILGVAGTTAAAGKRAQKQAHLADASSALNNLSEEDLNAVGQMRANKLMAEVNRYNAGGESPYQHLSNEDASKYQQARAEDMIKYASKGDEEDVDNIMSGTPFSKLKSPQAEYIQKYIENNFDFSKLYSYDSGKIGKVTKEEIISRLKGGSDINADV